MNSKSSHGWLDSSGAGCQLKKLLAQTRPKRSYPHDADLISHIRWLWDCFPKVRHEIKWVKSHQDNSTPFDSVPRHAQLNVMADQLATAYVKLPNPRFKLCNNSLFFPSSQVSLLVNGQKVTTHFQDAIRFHINGTSLQKHLQTSRGHWINNVCNTIDFQGLGLAYKQSHCKRGCRSAS